MQVNQVLHDQLETTRHSSPHNHTSEGAAAESSKSEVSIAMPSHYLDPEASLPVMSRPMASLFNPLDLESNGYPGHSHTEVGGSTGMEPRQPALDQEIAAYPDSKLRLNVIHEVQEEEVRYYPPKKALTYVIVM